MKNKILGTRKRSGMMQSLSCTILLCILSISSNLFAQTASNTQQTIKGVVYDENSQPIPGATVIVKGTSKGTATDFDGNYELTITEPDAVLEFSYIGYKTMELPISGQTIIDATMELDVESLKEVVVVGYGTQLKRDVTGATSTVKAEEIVKRPIVQVEQALQGTASGVVVTQNSGQPGQGMSVRIRGANSITGNNEPLYVIDGNIGGNITGLNPNDIESMEILKDASATAIYGSRGANGVVLITTKMGNSGKMQVNFNTWLSKASIPKHLDLMNAYDFATVVNTTNVSTGGSPAFTEEDLTYFQEWGGTDWHKELEQKPLIQNYDLNISGGSPEMRYRVSYNHLDQPGLIVNQYFKKDIFRTNLDLKAGERIDLKINLSALQNKGRNNSYQGDLTDPFSQANIWDPTSPVRNPETGQYIKNSTYGSTGFNPVAQANGQLEDTSSRSINGTGVLVYRITDDLTFTTNNTYNMGSGYNQAFRGLDTDEGNTNGVRATVYSNKSWSFQNSNFLTYKKSIGVHDITLMGLYEQYKYENEWVRANSNNLSTPSLGYYNLGLGASQQTTSGYTSDALQSYMVRVNYAYKNKYLLTSSVRVDGSSHLTDKYSIFPSIALGWNISEENFLKDSEILTTLKLRASYGETGNQAVGAYSTIPRIQTGGPYFYDGVTPSVTTPLGPPVSSDLKWEITKQTDIGLDMAFFYGRLNLAVDVYNKNITDLLYNYQAPFYLGGDSYQRNLGALNNKGLDFSISGNPIDGDAFSWSTNFTMSFNRNKVKDLGGLDNIQVNNIGSAQSGTTYLKVGRPLGEFYGYKFLGTWKSSEAAEAAEYGMQPGDAKYEDVNGDNVYNTDDLMVIGNGSPDFSFGFINDLKYQNFTLSFMFQGTSGNEIYSQTMAYLWGGQGQAKTPTTQEALNMWTPENETNNPAFSNTGKNFINSSRYVYDASYIKLKNISLAYDLPKGLLDKFGLNNMQIYISGQNVFTITDYPGYDPEVNNAQNALTQGLEMGVIPNPRTYTVGFRLGF
ncbi:SusC/RagA family TonB-linked outer membrane protein [Galbibacter pacificus]|uniref:TonB-dependent receptor n=1 Tax=Galbibacter pacificus TaxID=2996052 RepID=A0ABT6FMP5_9FLAO|nr:TonB-dependent receptor [Galbibacter pacificus]MDG3581059.1 TonB-dependent receptor [Galbibacter pacificus]MDG3584537.1 TonB-dependent receptor [Galbibacter pacificus]